MKILHIMITASIRIEMLRKHYNLPKVSSMLWTRGLRVGVAVVGAYWMMLSFVTDHIRGYK